MRWLSAVLLCLAVVPATITPAPAAAQRPDGGALVLHGSRTAYTELRLERALEIRCCQLVADWVRDIRLGPQATYAGFLIERMPARKVVFGVLRVPALDAGHPFLLPLASERVLPPGRYRIYLLGDEDVTVRVPVRGAGTVRHIYPSGAIRASGFVKEFNARLAHQREEVLIREGSLAVIALSLPPTQRQISARELCITPKDGYCGDGSGQYRYWTESGWSGLHYGRGALRAVPSEAVFTFGTIPSSTDARGFVFVLD